MDNKFYQDNNSHHLDNLDESLFEFEEIKNLQKRMNDPEFRKQLKNKQRKLSCLTCLIRIFCCPFIVIRNLTKI